MIALRPVLPLVNYAVNYEYIVKNLCENRNKPESTCKGKCYVEKELAKTEKQTTTASTLKLSGLDVFLFNEILQSLDPEIVGYPDNTIDSVYLDSHFSEYSSVIFHPPLA
ncbi:hypothetical protein [Chryseobacterium sp. Alg-005]|uniref:hypothetical protein n=1 Tax=Chryseobacterium sp. Alg-005 TaxID=3159516 RepID=UPI0036F24BB5